MRWWTWKLEIEPGMLSNYARLCKQTLQDLCISSSITQLTSYLPCKFTNCGNIRKAEELLSANEATQILEAQGGSPFDMWGWIWKELIKSYLPCRHDNSTCVVAPIENEEVQPCGCSCLVPFESHHDWPWKVFHYEFPDQIHYSSFNISMTCNTWMINMSSCYSPPSSNV